MAYFVEVMYADGHTDRSATEDFFSGLKEFMGAVNVCTDMSGRLVPEVKLLVFADTVRMEELLIYRTKGDEWTPLGPTAPEAVTAKPAARRAAVHRK